MNTCVEIWGVAEGNYGIITLAKGEGATVHNKEGRSTSQSIQTSRAVV